jgi:hypothetical protein
MRVVPSAAAVERARACAAGKSRSYVQDSEYLARVVVAIADGVLGNGVQPAPIEIAQPVEVTK